MIACTVHHLNSLSHDNGIFSSQEVCLYMNASIVLAVPQPRAEPPPARVQKGVPDGFARALAEQRKVCQTAESDTTNGVTDRNAELASDASAGVSAQTAEAMPQPPMGLDTSQSGDASTAETHLPDSKKTMSATIAVAVVPSAVLPPPMQALIAMVLEEVGISVPTSNAATILAPTVKTDSIIANSSAMEQSKTATDVSVFLRVLLNAAAGAIETEPLPVSLDMDADFVAAISTPPTPAQAADAATALSAAKADVATALPTGEAGVVTALLAAEADIATELPAAEAVVTPAKPENGAKASSAMGVSSRTVQHAAPSDTPAAPVAAEHISATMLQEVAVKGVRYLIGAQDKTIAVRLVPPSLGELHIEVTTTGDALRVRLFSANPVVREALESHLQALRDTFVANNIDVKNISVLSGMAGQTSGHPFANPQFTDVTGNAVPHTMAAALRPAASAEKDVSMAYSPPHDGALNVLV